MYPSIYRLFYFPLFLFESKNKTNVGFGFDGNHMLAFFYIRLQPGKPYPVRRLLSTSISFISSTYCTSGNDKLLKSSLMFNNLMQQKDFILYEMQ